MAGIYVVMGQRSCHVLVNLKQNTQTIKLLGTLLIIKSIEHHLPSAIFSKLKIL